MTATPPTHSRDARPRQPGARAAAVGGRDGGAVGRAAALRGGRRGALSVAAAALCVGFGAGSAAADGVYSPLAETDRVVAPLAETEWSLSASYLRARVAAQRNDMVAAARAFQIASRLQPSDPVLVESSMFFSLVVGDVVEAIEAAAQLRAFDGDDGLRLMLTIVQAVADERFDLARDLLVDEEAASEIPPFLARLASGWIEAGRGDIVGAQATFLERRDDAPEIVELLAAYHAAMLEASFGVPADAAEALLGVAAIAEQSEPSVARNGRFAIAVASALTRAGRAEEAAARLEEIAERYGRTPMIEAAAAELSETGTLAPTVASPRDGVAETLYAYAGALAGDENRRQAALAYVQMALFLRPDLDEARLLAGELLALSDQHEAAASAFARVEPAGPFGEAGASGQAEAYRRAGDFDKALAALSAYAAFVGAPSPRIEIERAGVLQSMRAFEECAAVYGAALAEIGGREGGFIRSDWDELFGHAICLERSGAWDEAEERLRLALDLNPEQPEVLNYLGYSLVEQRRNLDEALELLRLAAERRPTSGHIVDSLGWALYRLGQYEESVVELQRAAALEPTIAVINDHLGDALWKVGRRYEARFHWLRALSLEDEIGEVDRARVEDKLERGLDAVLADELAEDGGAAPGPKPESDG